MRKTCQMMRQNAVVRLALLAVIVNPQLYAQDTTPPDPPHHYPHARFKVNGLGSGVIGPLEEKLLRESLDMVTPNWPIVSAVHAIAPQTPELMYTNVSNIYSELFVDWLNWADAHGVSREDAFYHAGSPSAYSGAGGSTVPVDEIMRWARFFVGPPANIQLVYNPPYAMGAAKTLRSISPIRRNSAKSI
jgi:hypothetical protein